MNTPDRGQIGPWPTLQKPEEQKASPRTEYEEGGTGGSRGVSLTLAQLQALAWTDQVLAGRVLSPL